MIFEAIKKNSRSILIVGLIFVFIVLILFLVVIYSLKTKPPPKDLIRGENIGVIRATMELYRDENNAKYFQSFGVPTSIGEYGIPKNPDGEPYGWIDNTSDDQTYCVWTKFKTKNTYFISSPCGMKEAKTLPTTLKECCELSLTTP